MASAGTAAIGAAAAAYYLSKDEGTQRAGVFWFSIAPIYCHYRIVQILNRNGLLSDARADGLYEECHKRYSEPVKELTFRMRGFYLKQAQIVSTQDDFVPAAYMSWVKKTQDDIPSEFVGSQARDFIALKLKEELGLEFDDVFSSFDDKPLGVASIGQVHKAVLRKDGKTVAIKFLCPGIESKFRGDIKTIRGFCEFALPQHVPAFAEIEKQFCTEFDYRGEARNLELVRNNMRDLYKDRIELPRPHLELCSKHILVQEYLDGVNLVTGIKAQFQSLAALQGKTLEELIAERKKLIESGEYKFKTIEEESRDQARVSFLLRLGDLTTNLPRFFYNWSVLRLVYGPVEYASTPPLIDLGKILRLLCTVHGHQLFVNGAFQADGHPGNFLLLKDGRIGLIDYGQVKHMTRDERIKYAKLMLAHARKDKAEVVRIHFDLLGVKTKFRNADIAYRYSALMNDRDDFEIMQGLNLSSFSDYCERIDPIVELPDNYLMAQRMSLLLRGMGKAFGVKVVMSQMWKQQAEELLKREGVDS